MSQGVLVDASGNPLIADGPQFGPERAAFGPVRFEHQPAWVRSRGRKQKAGNKRAKGMLQALADAGRATLDDLAALAGFKSKKSSGGKKRRKRRSGGGRVYYAAGGSKKARRSARRYQARLRSKMSGFHSMLGSSSLGKRAAARLRRRLARCGDNQRLGSRSSISRKHARALRRELRQCQTRKIQASSYYAGMAVPRSKRRGASRRLARSGASGGMRSYAKLMRQLRGTRNKAWICVGPKRTGCGGGRKGRRGARVWGVLRP